MRPRGHGHRKVDSEVLPFVRPAGELRRKFRRILTYHALAIIVKAEEFSALDKKVDALNDRLTALEAKVESKLDAIIARLS